MFTLEALREMESLEKIREIIIKITAAKIGMVAILLHYNDY